MSLKKIQIICDQREKASKIDKDLLNLNKKDLEINLKYENLEVGDFQISNECVIERKTILDLESSIIDGRIFSQIQSLKKIPKSLFIIEGDLDYIYNNESRIHKSALLALLSSISLDYRIPIFFTKNKIESSYLIYTFAKREQLKEKKEIKLRYAKQKMSFSQRQRFIIESFPDIGPNVSKSILKEFKSIKNFMNADINQLKKINKLGLKKAKNLNYLINRKS